jgi:predicted ATPase with chaperone activity
VSKPRFFSSFIFRMIAPPSTGKTMLSRRLPTLLPPLTLIESLEITRIGSATGKLNPGQPLLAHQLFVRRCNASGEARR